MSTASEALSRHRWDRTWGSEHSAPEHSALQQRWIFVQRVQLLPLLLVGSLLDVSFLLSAHKHHNAFSHLLHSLIASSPHTILPVLFSMAFHLPCCNCALSSFRFRENFLLSGPHYQTPAQSQPLPPLEEVPVSQVLPGRRFAASSCAELQYTSRLDRLKNTSSSERRWTGPVHTSSTAFGRKLKLLKAEWAELGTHKCATFAACLSHFLSSQWKANKAAPAAATGTRCDPAPAAQLLAVERTRLGLISATWSPSPGICGCPPCPALSIGSCFTTGPFPPPSWTEANWHAGRLTASPVVLWSSGGT